MSPRPVLRAWAMMLVGDSPTPHIDVVGCVGSHMLHLRREGTRHNIAPAVGDTDMNLRPFGQAPDASASALARIAELQAAGQRAATGIVPLGVSGGQALLTARPTNVYAHFLVRYRNACAAAAASTEGDGIWLCRLPTLASAALVDSGLVVADAPGGLPAVAWEAVLRALGRRGEVGLVDDTVPETLLTQVCPATVWVGWGDHARGLAAIAAALADDADSTDTAALTRLLRAACVVMGHPPMPTPRPGRPALAGSPS